MIRLLTILILVSNSFLIRAQTNTFPITGNVGIGTTNPSANLDFYRIYNSSQTKILKMFYEGSWGFASYADNFRFLDLQSTEGGKVLQVNGYGVGMGYDPPSINSPDKLYVNGRVGIGTNSPQQKLSINEASNENTYLTIQNNTIGTIFGSGGTSIGLTGTTTNHDFSLYTNLIERMRITSVGNVGIGTADTKGYKLAVAGNVIAESMKVKLQGTWPDFVFAKSYKLPTLQETEAHIKEKGHLPGIPSAEEVKDKGIDLGDMNARLLQKIEELTLHLIEMKKENDQQQEDIKYLKSKIDREK